MFLCVKRDKQKALAREDFKKILTLKKTTFLYVGKDFPGLQISSLQLPKASCFDFSTGASGREATRLIGLVFAEHFHDTC